MAFLPLITLLHQAFLWKGTLGNISVGYKNTRRQRAGIMQSMIFRKFKSPIRDEFLI